MGYQCVDFFVFKQSFGFWAHHSAQARMMLVRHLKSIIMAIEQLTTPASSLHIQPKSCRFVSISSTPLPTVLFMMYCMNSRLPYRHMGHSQIRRYHDVCIFLCQSNHLLTAQSEQRSQSLVHSGGTHPSAHYVKSQHCHRSPKFVASRPRGGTECGHSTRSRHTARYRSRVPGRHHFPRLA